MNITDEILMAYVDDELDPATRAEVAAAIARDSALAARVQEQRELRAQLRGAFDPVLEERVPERLIAAASAPVDPKHKVVDLEEVRHRRTVVPASRWSLPQWAAVAASLLVGLFVGHHALQSEETVVMRNGALVAGGTLASALNTQLSSDAGDAHHIGLTFRTTTGEYCRTFTSNAKQAVAGVACHDADEWKVRAVTEVPGAGANYRMASSALPAAVRALVEESMQGEPLDVEAEKAARAQRWK